MEPGDQGRELGGFEVSAKCEIPGNSQEAHLRSAKAELDHVMLANEGRLSGTATYYHSYAKAPMTIVRVMPKTKANWQALEVNPQVHWFIQKSCRASHPEGQIHLFFHGSKPPPRRERWFGSSDRSQHERLSVASTKVSEIGVHGATHGNTNEAAIHKGIEDLGVTMSQALSKQKYFRAEFSRQFHLRLLSLWMSQWLFANTER